MMSSKNLAITEVELAGEKYPVSFGNMALITFEDRYGIGPADLQEVLTGGKLKPMIQLFHCGLEDGHRKAGKTFELTWQETADQIFDRDPNYAEKMITALVAALPYAEDDEEDSKKKKGKRTTRVKATPIKK